MDHKNEKDLVKKVAASFRINVTAPDGSVKKWTIDAKSNPPYVGNEERPVEIEISLKDGDFMNMAAGKMKPDQAFMQGKMKLKGNIAKAMKLKNLLDPKMLKAKI
ncbi:SCP-2 sterol transfer family protein [Ancylostoma ceylanicum]|uniref:SCP-2 sterol transfer family protein n=1 Tax=Ancylostoma ceylanicum TaxID=53326 RepID=A0A0D6LVF7_9BILA|nr:SCP-2 sterol transfer family protein [Ancylostoma ceylanicum]